MASVFGITYVDLQNFSSVATVAAVFNDTNDGTAPPSLNTVAIAAVIDRGEQEVLSWLGDEYGPPPFSTTALAQLGADPLLKYAAIEYAVAHMFDRHPEYVRDGRQDRSDRFKRADIRMGRILDSRQRPPTVPITPANVGGVSVDKAARMYTDDPCGRRHSGDY